MAKSSTHKAKRQGTNLPLGSWSPGLEGTGGTARKLMTTSPVSPLGMWATPPPRRRLRVQTNLAKKNHTNSPRRWQSNTVRPQPFKTTGYEADVSLSSPGPRGILKRKREEQARRVSLRSPQKAVPSSAGSNVSWSPDDDVRLFKRGSVVSPHLATGAEAATRPPPASPQRAHPAADQSASSPRTPTTPQRLGNLFSNLPGDRRKALGMIQRESPIVHDIIAAKTRRQLAEQVHRVLTRDGLHALFGSTAQVNDEVITAHFERFEVRYLGGQDWLNMSTRARVTLLVQMMIDEFGLEFPGEIRTEGKLLNDIRHFPNDEAELYALAVDEMTTELDIDSWRNLWTILMALSAKFGLEGLVRFALKGCSPRFVSEMRNDPKFLIKKGMLHPASPQKSLAAVVADDLVRRMQRTNGVPPARLFELATYIGLDTPTTDQPTTHQSDDVDPDEEPAEVSAFCWVCMSTAGETDDIRREHFENHRSELEWARITAIRDINGYHLPQNDGPEQPEALSSDYDFLADYVSLEDSGAEASGSGGGEEEGNEMEDQDEADDTIVVVDKSPAEKASTKSKAKAKGKGKAKKKSKK